MTPKETGAGKRLYELRIKNSKTMEEVVIEFNERFGTNITRSNISRWERGICEPSLSMAKKLCAYYEITADYLIGLNESNNDDYLHEESEI